jgi:gluconate 2-dehydrogenase alpha chain
MARKLPRKDVAVIGLGWTGSILSHELCKAGLDVVAIERGPWRDTATEFSIAYAQDELRYRLQHELFLRPAQTSVTFRNNGAQTALPVRTWGAFMLGNGAGGAGVHWNAETWRFLPTDFVLRTHLTQRYGAGFLPEDMTIQDWGLTYDELAVCGKTSPERRGSDSLFPLIRREDLRCVDNFSIKAECSLTFTRNGAFPRTILCARSGNLSVKF